MTMTSAIMDPHDGFAARFARGSVFGNPVDSLRRVEKRVRQLEGLDVFWHKVPLGITTDSLMAHRATFGAGGYIFVTSRNDTILRNDWPQWRHNSINLEVNCASLQIAGVPCLEPCETPDLPAAAPITCEGEVCLDPEVFCAWFDACCGREGAAMQAAGASNPLVDLLQAGRVERKDGRLVQKRLTGPEEDCGCSKTSAKLAMTRAADPDCTNCKKAKLARAAALAAAKLAASAVLPVLLLVFGLHLLLSATGGGSLALTLGACCALGAVVGTRKGQVAAGATLDVAVAEETPTPCEPLCIPITFTCTLPADVVRTSTYAKACLTDGEGSACVAMPVLGCLDETCDPTPLHVVCPDYPVDPVA